MHESKPKIDLLAHMSAALRVLSVDMVEKAKSGHPGMPLGIADVITVLFTQFLKFNPNDPSWINRDRFVLSAGHGSAILYSLLFLLGYKNYNLEQLKNFRQLGSITAGHPEYDVANGVETSTGPLGQGLANAVGMAIAAKHLQAKFGEKLINNKTYVIVGDGCLAEGISHEACSLAGHLNLNNLVILFDDNQVTIDGSTKLSCSDNHLARFQAYGFHTITIDGHNYAEISEALIQAQNSDKPIFIACKTTIGLGCGEKSGHCSVHGAPLGVEGIQNVRNFFNWHHQPFEIPDDVLSLWNNVKNQHQSAYDNWQQEYKSTDLGQQLNTFLNKETSTNSLTQLKKEKLGVDEASRKSSGSALVKLTDNIPNLIGGSADLSKSNCTFTTAHQFISAEDFVGNFINYGIREHAMAAIMNGLAQYGGIIPYGSTFLVFSDYLRPALRLAAMMNLHVIHIFTHDSIGLGEDGPTHQPVEHLASLRAIPNLLVLRPADAVETIECWQIAINAKQPVVLALSRQNLQPCRSEHHANNLCQLGAYKLVDKEAAKIAIFASGSEVGLAIQVHQILLKNNVKSTIISVPSIELFKQQSAEYRDNLMNNTTLKIVIEAGVKQGWEAIIGNEGLFFGINNFGTSGKGADIYKHFGLTAENIATKILNKISCS